MYVTNISEAKAQLSALIEKVLAGEEVIIGKAGRPVAKLIRYDRSEKPRQPGSLKGKSGCVGSCNKGRWVWHAKEKSKE